MTRFKASEVKSNGIGGAGYQGALKSKDKIQKIVEQVREKIGLDAIWKEVNGENDRGPYYAGSRFNSVEDVTYRLVSALGNWSYKNVQDELLVEMNVKFIAETISEEDAITIVIDAHRDCASADHWYTFEKDWG